MLSRNWRGVTHTGSRRAVHETCVAMYKFDGLIECLSEFKYRGSIPFTASVLAYSLPGADGQHFDVVDALQSAARFRDATAYAPFAAYRHFRVFHVRRYRGSCSLPPSILSTAVSEERLRARHQETDLRDPCQSSKEPRLSTPWYPGTPDCLRSPIWHLSLRLSPFISTPDCTISSTSIHIPAYHSWIFRAQLLFCRISAFTVDQPPK